LTNLRKYGIIIIPRGKENKKMKKVKNEAMWYLICDGQGARVTNDIEEARSLNVVIVEITANEAASILALTLANK
jgi:hypothetical protein